MCVYLVVCTWVRVEDPCKGNAIKRKGDEKKSLFVIRLRCQSSISLFITTLFYTTENGRASQFSRLV